ncbi:hypothetical protein CM19_04060 [Candidatus Acidianus copahuensis]|uniref:HD domain-containing protein n=1 Tax=Candidatus Acidianus copahuensis TaxID=1160895 RepID=A0A031LU39_9CREN|nr:HD domain-containing protein [Candidatus Acidianus copahuensis]EZQ10628.1 hypothetical protein CM19_04060 [Candidatus Acidianus copahuensis]
MIRKLYFNGKPIPFTEGERKEAVEDFKNVMVDILTIIDEISKEKNFSPQQFMEILDDLISAFYKAPIFLTHVNYVVKGKEYMPNNFDYLILYSILRHLTGKDNIGKLLSEERISVDNILSLLDGKNEEIKDDVQIAKKIIDYLRSRDISPKIKKVYKALISTPEDTRPGLNFTSLASHLTLTSLLLWLNESESIPLNYLRFAALMHDIGKLSNPEHHVKEVNDIFNSIISDAKQRGVRKEFLDELEKAKDRAYSHHEPNKTTELQQADRIAAEHQRDMDKVKTIVKENFKDVLNCYESRSFDCITDEIKYDNISSTIYQKLHSGKTEERSQPQGKPKGYIYMIDFPGVQAFINNFSKLPEISAASFMVDFLSATLPFIALDLKFRKGNIPLEAILSGYGGHSYLVIRSDLDPTEVKDTVSSLGGEIDIKIQVYSSPFFIGDHIIEYNTFYSIISEQSFLNRYSVDWKENILSYGLHKLCDNCRIRPAKNFSASDNRYLCDLCNLVRKFSEKRGFTARSKTEYIVGENRISLNKGIKDPSCYLTGCNADKGYVSVIRFDANDAGKYYGSSITFGEYIDKSYLLDYYVKESFFQEINKLYKEVNDDVLRVILGIQYLGGDEGLLIVPPIYAIKFLKESLSYASENTGLTFKVGIVTVDCSHPIQFAYNVSEELEEEAKIKDESKNSIGVLTITSGLITDSSFYSIAEEFSSTFYIKNEFDLMDEILKFLGLNSYAELKKIKDSNAKSDEYNKFKDFLREIESILSRYNQKKDIYDVISMIIREMNRVNSQDLKNILKLLLTKTSINDGDVRNRLLDFYYILKTLEVGSCKR